LEDLGFHSYGNNWWTNEECPSAYSYSNLNKSYTEEYFESEYHVNRSQAENLYNYMQEIYLTNIGKNFDSVLEFGCGSGELTDQLHEHDLSFCVIEGSAAGFYKLMYKGYKFPNVLRRDLRKIENLSLNVDLVICTEVAEHIEPWFASKIVEACINNSNVVWFSAADKDRPAHYHHPNEAPIWAWDNIFKFYGYKYIELDGRFDRADRLYINEN